MLSGTPPLLGQEWNVALHEHAQRAFRRNPDDILLLYEESMSASRILSFDILMFFAKLGAGKVSDEEFDTQSREYIRRLNHWEDEFPIRLMQPQNIVKDIPEPPHPEFDDGFNPYKTGIIFGGDNFSTNMFRLTILGLRNMFESKLAAWKGLPKPEQSSKDLAKTIFETVNAIRYWPHSPPGAMLSTRAVFSLAVFLGPTTDPREVLWARQTFAAIESEG
jgi:hypothetical protein